MSVGRRLGVVRRAGGALGFLGRAGGPAPLCRRPRWALRGERGSVLVLVPTGFLVLLLLGGIAVNSAAAYLGQRQLADALAAAANDAATAGLSNAAFYGSGEVTLDPAAVAAVACASIAAQDDGDLGDLRLAVGVDGRVVALRASAEVRSVFGAALPGLATRTVSAEAVGEAEEGPGPPAPAPATLTPVNCDGA